MARGPWKVHGQLVFAHKGECERAYLCWVRSFGGAARLALPFESEGHYEVTLAAVDRLGNVEAPETVPVRVDLTAPSITGMPSQPCRIWPPNERMVQVADVVGHVVPHDRRPKQ